MTSRLAVERREEEVLVLVLALVLEVLLLPDELQPVVDPLVPSKRVRGWKKNLKKINFCAPDLIS